MSPSSSLAVALGVALVSITLWAPDAAAQETINSATVEHLQFMVVGALIILFLIVEPHGLARLWQIGKQKLRVWPFPY